MFFFPWPSRGYYIVARDSIVRHFNAKNISIWFHPAATVITALAAVITYDLQPPPFLILPFNSRVAWSSQHLSPLKEADCLLNLFEIFNTAWKMLSVGGWKDEWGEISELKRQPPSCKDTLFKKRKVCSMNRHTEICPCVTLCIMLHFWICLLCPPHARCLLLDLQLPSGGRRRKLRIRPQTWRERGWGGD